MKQKFSKVQSVLLASSIFLILASLLAFQPPIEEGKLTVSGKVKDEKNKSLDSTLILITDSTGFKVIDSVYTSEKGKFSFKLDYNQVYRTYYSKDGFVTVFDEYNTEVPSSKTYKELNYNLVRNLFSDSSDFNERAAERHPLSKISFNRAYDGFFEDFESITTFLDEVTKPNVGEMIIAGTFQDSLTDSFNVDVLALDTLGFELAKTTSDADGNYEVTVPLMNKIKLKFVSGDHYESFATVNSGVPEQNSGDDYTVKQDFVLVNKLDSTINDEAFNKPIARIEHLEERGAFVENPAVAAVFNDQLLVEQRRIVLSGMLTDQLNSTISNTMITVKDGPRIVDEVVADSNDFQVNLPYGAIAHVYFKTNDYHESFISYNTNLTPEEMQKNKSLTTQVELYSRDRTDINPVAFNYPAAKYYYDRNLDNYEADSSVSSDFLAKLETPIAPEDTSVADGFLVLRGGVIDPGNGNKKVPEARIRVLDQNRQVTSSFSTDKKGRYQVDLGLNKTYYLEVEKEEYLATQIKIDTRVPGQYRDTTIEQIGVALPITHPDNEIAGKQVPAELLKKQEITAFYVEDSTLELREDLGVFDEFAEAVAAYVDPNAEIPAVTEEQLAEEERKKKELEDALAAEKAAKEAEALAAAALAAEAAKAKEAEQEKEKEKETEVPALKEPDLRIAGKVVDERNVPVEGVVVSLKESRKVLAEQKTDSLGNYNIKVPNQKDMTMAFEKKNLYTVTASVNTTYPDTLEPKDDILTFPDLKIYNKSNVGINSDAFDQDWQYVAYNPGSNGFAANEDVPGNFASVLNSTPDNQYLIVSGRAKDQDGKNLDGAKVLVKANGRIVKTIFSDKKGRYDVKLDYQKDYRIEVTKEGYKSTFAAVSTKTSDTEEKLIDKRVKSFNLLLVSREEDNINDQVFFRPYAQVAYDENSGEFIEVTDVNNSFLADLYIEQEKGKKKEYQLESKTVAAAFEVSDEKGYKEYVSRSGNSKEAAQKRAQNKNAANKAASPFMGDFYNAINGIQQNRRSKIRDVNLTLNEIYNVRMAMSQQPKMEVDENLLDVNKQKDLINNIIATALGMRKDADLVSTDSTLNVNLGIRIRHVDEGKGLYTTSRDQVFMDGQMIEYVETTDWFIWSNRYKNNVQISESTYIAELDSLKRIGYQIN